MISEHQKNAGLLPHFRCLLIQTVVQEVVDTLHIYQHLATAREVRDLPFLNGDTEGVSGDGGFGVC